MLEVRRTTTRRHGQARAELPLHADHPRAANALIANNRSQKAKTSGPTGEGEPVHVRELEDEQAEARFVAAEMERHVDAGGSRDDVAVFYRANGQSRVMEDELAQARAATR